MFTGYGFFLTHSHAGLRCGGSLKPRQDLVMLPPPKVIRIVSDEGSGGFSQFSSSPASPSTRSHDERRTQKYLDATVPDPVTGPLVQDPVTRIQSGERYFSRQVYGPS